MKVLFIGDIVGKSGRTAVKALLPNLVDKYKIDIVIANGENIAAGFGLTEPLVAELFKIGIHIITTGNHVWDKKEFIPYISKDNRVLRPLNYPPGVPGSGSIVISIQNGLKVAVMNISGRVFMPGVDCPFRTGRAELDMLSKETDIIIVDFHAEATSEKIAFGYFVDGRASAVIGTHTHVQTADERILPGGTGYLTDAGMTGPVDSVIGMKREIILERFLSQLPQPFKVATQNIQLQGVLLKIDAQGRCQEISRLVVPVKS